MRPWPDRRLMLAGLMVSLAGAAQATPVLRVCIADIAYPPSITLDPQKPGLRERQFLDAGRAAGVMVRLQYAPIRRCQRMVRDGELDVVYMAATQESLTRYQFPRDERGALDRSLRLKEEAVILVQRRGQSIRWDGQRFSGPARLGTRAGLVMAQEAVKERRLALTDASAADAEHALRMVAAGRYDFAVLLEVDLRGQGKRMKALDLEALSEPIARFDGFMAGSPQLSAERQAGLQAWWRALPHWVAPAANRPPAPRGPSKL